MIRAAILGGTGYGGMELLRLLLGHPGVEVTAVTSRGRTGRVAAAHPHLEGFTDLEFSRDAPPDLQDLARDNEVLFQAKPHGVSAAETPGLLEASPEVRIIDLSGDYRLRDAAAYPTWYGYAHPHPERLADAAYGLPECGGREAVRDARLVANPGCHATATILALWPLARAGIARGPAAVTSVTGSSGSGAEPKAGTHHPERFTNFKAYRPLRHQHLPEIVQQLGDVQVAFVPCSAPLARGIYVTALVPVGDGGDQAVAAAYHEAYGAERFVRLRDAPPDLRTIVGTNLADISATVRGGMACVTVAIDNLGKGMAGTAVQNLNLLFDLPEASGLDRPGMGL